MCKLHLSTSKKCPENPYSKGYQKITPEKANPWGNKTAKAKQQQETQTPPKIRDTNKKEELHTTLGKMLANFTKTNATQEQKLEFLESPNKIIKLFEH